MREHGAKVNILAAKDVELADFAALESREMACGDVIDMDEIKTGVHIGRHMTQGCLEHQAAGRRWLDIARADRCRRIDDDGG